MQDVDRPAEIQALPEPAGTRRPRIETQALPVVAGPQSLDGVSRHLGGRRHLGQRAAVRPPESEGPVGAARDLVALLVYRSVMPATEEREVREGGRASVRPVADVMPLGETRAAAREAAALIPMLKRSSQRQRNGPRPGPYLHDAPLPVVAHE
jgi:hypothetical protein